MVALRKANSYSKRIVVPYTRKSKVKSKAYIKTIPPQKIAKFSMGKPNLTKLPHHLTMVSAEPVQLRHNAIEACRQYLNKELDTNLADKYFFRVVCYPHHIQRENRMLTGAGADRMQTGMQLSFGVSMGKAALLKEGSKIFFIAVENEKAVVLIRDLFNKIKSKLPGKTRVLYEFVSDSDKGKKI